MTQSAISQQIRALETRFGVALFDRHARGLTLTDEGRKLLPQVEVALESLSAAMERFEAGASQSYLVVSGSISVIEWVICPALPAFTKRYPNVSIRFQTANWPDEFAISQADVEIRFGSERQVGTNAIFLLPNNLMVLRSPRLKGDLTELPLIEAVGTSQGWAKWGEAAGLHGLSPSFFTDTYGLALQMAATGNGVALTSSLLAANAIEAGVVEQAHPTTIPGKEGYFLAVDRSVAAAAAFADWLLEVTNDRGLATV